MVLTKRNRSQVEEDENAHSILEQINLSNQAYAQLVHTQFETIQICKRSRTLENCMENLLQDMKLPTITNKIYQENDQNFQSFDELMNQKEFWKSMLNMECSVSIYIVLFLYF
jgi:hypothetical protein